MILGHMWFSSCGKHVSFFVVCTVQHYLLVFCLIFMSVVTLLLTGKGLPVLQYKQLVHEVDSFIPLVASRLYLSSSADSDNSKQASSASPAGNISESTSPPVGTPQNVDNMTSNTTASTSAESPNKDAAKNGGVSDKASGQTPSKNAINEIVVKGDVLS